MSASRMKLKSPFRLNSIGAKAGAAMAALTVLLLTIAGVGLSGITTLSGAVFQTESTSQVLIAVNEAGGSISEYLLQKDPERIEAASTTLENAYGMVEGLELEPEAREALEGRISAMSEAVKSLASANDRLEGAKAAFAASADELLAQAVAAEQKGAAITKTAEREATDAILSLDTLRQLTLNAGRLATLVQEIRLASLEGQAVVGDSTASARVNALLEQAREPLKGIVDLGGAPDLQSVISTIAQSFQALETQLARSSQLSPASAAIAGRTADASMELITRLGAMAEAELALKKDKDNERSRARVFSGLARNFADLIRDAVLGAERYAATQTAETADTVRAGLDKAANFAKILAKNGAEGLGAGVDTLKDSFETLVTAASNFDERTSAVVEASEAVSRSVVEVASATTEQAQAQSRQSGWLMWGAGLVCLLLTATIAVILIRSIARPIIEITQAMLRLANGDTSVETAFVRRRDEIGGMARSLTVFQETGRAKVAAEAEAERQRRDAEEARARHESEQMAEARALSDAFAAISAGLDALASGDLSARVGEVDEKYQPIRDRFNESVASLETTIGAAVSSAGAIRTGLAEISSASLDLAKRTERQAANLAETVTTLSQVTEASGRTAEGARRARQSADGALDTARQGGEVVAEAITAMNAIETSSSAIEQIVGLINDIAFQTNLLALNAGVEAARAGAAGQGFAVVAHEVRELSQRSATAAKEISDLIGTSRQQVGLGVERVSASGKALEKIVSEVGQMVEVIGLIADDAREQAASLRGISSAADQMDQATQESAAMVEETTTACRSLEIETEELDASMQRFRTSGHAGQSSHHVAYGRAA
ncbi:MAG: HAMP domain-containing protein [Fulvimarina manganoxydans]|uniref:methyl-accepting chemotaxis protein n=1 Tax=Fulvimarina manganoxydans TaxID=937218 RepID=UPI00235495D0|nr:methyl-accepting chemotaxis protein [Fulvimarina manganoxydans]MCK5934198.1 HAMP domain-containing protein [Fulvimarina manganoxydans]